MSAASKNEKPYRGSRKHILDWVESPRFLGELKEMLKPVDVEIPSTAAYMPMGYASPQEAKLDEVSTEFAIAHGVRDELRDWWLRHHIGANTPNWDLIVECSVEGRPGLILMEAKANVPELKKDCMFLAAAATENSRENHDQISKAIAEARAGLKAVGIEARIRIDSHYQLANRIAFMWKLASHGIPTVLVYLGFTGDAGIADAGAPFISDSDWQNVFDEYARSILPVEMRERRLDLGAAPAWFLLRSRKVVELSPPSACIGTK